MLFSTVGNNIISLLIILLFYFTLWEFPQAIDLLLIFNQVDQEKVWEIPTYYALLLLLGSLIWIAPLYFDQRIYRNFSVKDFFTEIPEVQQTETVVRIPGSNYLKKKHIEKTLPKILGSLLIIISSLGVLHAYEVSEDKQPLGWSAMTYLLITSVFFLLLLIYPFYLKIRNLLLKIPGSKYFVLLIFLLIVGFIVVLGIFNRQDEIDVLKLFMSNSLLAILFLGFTFLFRKIRSEKIRRRIFQIVLWLIIANVIAYLAFAFYPPLAKTMNPLLVVLVSIITFYVIAFLLKYWGLRYKVPFLTLFIILLVVFGEITAAKKNFDHYAIESVKDGNDRNSLDQHIDRWFSDRKDIILSSEKNYPLILVSSEGGGSRAGLWSFLVHSYLYEQYPGYFTDHLFSLTGASGGGVGNSMFYAKASQIAKEDEDYSFLADNNNSNGYKYRASEMYSENFLSTSISGLLGRDLFQSIFDLFSFDDRGRLLEEEWEDAHFEYVSKEKGKPLLSREFLSFFEHENAETSPPLLVINTTHIQSGQYSLISPVSFDTIRELPGFKDFILKYQKEYPHSTFRLSTAMSLTARFPYISPVARVPGLGQYADAGYYDNIGGAVTKRLKEIIEKSWEEFKDGDSLIPENKELNIIELVIRNEESTPKLKYSTQLRAPLTALLNVRSGHTREMKKYLGEDWEIILERTPIPPPEDLLAAFMEQEPDPTDTTTIKPILPLGRYMSRVAILSMEKRLEDPEVKARLDSLVRLMKEFDQEGKTVDGGRTPE